MAFHLTDLPNGISGAVAKAPAEARSRREGGPDSHWTKPINGASQTGPQSLDAGVAIGRRHTFAESPPRGSPLPSSRGHGFGLRSATFEEFRPACWCQKQADNQSRAHGPRVPPVRGWLCLHQYPRWSVEPHACREAHRKPRRADSKDADMPQQGHHYREAPAGGGPCPKPRVSFRQPVWLPRPFALTRVERANLASQNCLQVRTGLWASLQGISCRTAGYTTSTFQYRQFWPSRRPDSWAQAVR